MNPHDSNSPPKQSIGRFMILFYFAVLGVVLLSMYTGYTIGKSHVRPLKACEEPEKRVQRMPVTKAEKSAFIQYYSNRGM